MASIWSCHFMGNRWGNSGNSVRLYFLGSKITADGDCSHEIKRCLLLGKNVMTNLDSIFKSRDITLPTKVRLVKAMVFPVVNVWMWELDCEESINSSAFSLLYSPTLTSIHDYWKNHSFDYTDLSLAAKSQLFNMLSRLVITFLPRSKRLLISWLQSPSAVILEHKK